MRANPRSNPKLPSKATLRDDMAPKNAARSHDWECRGQGTQGAMLSPLGREHAEV
jgi:hypothetical protein